MALSVLQGRNTKHQLRQLNMSDIIYTANPLTSPDKLINEYILILDVIITLVNDGQRVLHSDVRDKDGMPQSEGVRITVL